MPNWVAEKNEKIWNKAKLLAKNQGHEDDWDYITAIYKNLGGQIESFKKPIINKLTEKFEEQNFKEFGLSDVKKLVGKFIDNPIKAGIAAYLVYKILKSKKENYSEAQKYVYIIEIIYENGKKKIKSNHNNKPILYKNEYSAQQQIKFYMNEYNDTMKHMKKPLVKKCNIKKVLYADYRENNINTLNEDLSMNDDLIQTKLFNGWKFNSPKNRSIWSASKNGVFVDVDKYGDNEYVIRFSGKRKDQWKVNKQNINRDIKQILKLN